ncbi:MAG: hypothetical protein MJE66_14295 [Proteobacteria bacterium]|nr:hypothetical protein [Pseudomonadota bacterium]
MSATEHLVFDFRLDAAPDERGDVTRATGSFRLFVGPELFFEEDHFPVVELAAALAEWLSGSPETGGFSFHPRDAMLGDVIGIDPGVEGFRFRAQTREFASPIAFAWADVRRAVVEFLAAVDAALQAEYGLPLPVAFPRADVGRA